MSETILNTIWESKWTTRLERIAAIVAILLLCRLGLEEDLSWVAWVIISIVVALLTLTRWPYGALLVLVGMSAMPRFFVELFGWKARPEHFAVAIVFVAVGFWLVRNKLKIRLEKLDYWVLGYVAINYVSSAFVSSSSPETLRWALLDNLAVLPYFLIRVLVKDLKVLRKTFRILLGVGLAESAYGILCYASHHVFGTNVGMEIGQYGVDVAAPYGSLFEPNLFGAYAACCAALFLAVYLAHEQQRRLGYLLGFVITSLATVLSFSRAALFALVVAVIWILWKARHPAKPWRNKLGVSTLGFGLILLIAASAVGGVLRERFTNLFQQGLAEETAVSRLIITEEALKDIPSHPFLGSGTASFNLSFDWARYVPEWGGGKTWIGNAPLRILHDTGLVGLTAILGFFALLWRKIRQVPRRQNLQVPMLLALTAGTLVYGISFQFTDGTNLAFCWVQLGFLASAALLMSDRSQQGKINSVRDSGAVEPRNY